jgi:hypothetical protein
MPRRDISSVNSIEIDNQSASKVSVSISYTKKGPFIENSPNVILPHNKAKQISLGTLPCRFIKLNFHKGAPISVKSITAYGCDVLDTELSLGMGAYSVFVEKAHKIVY